ncbi:hypothetical protein BS50DRAFT_570584 [Corynespora cassiicola Philippines]|uniref:Transcription factor TFIIIB component B'' Myb domain-containing protein n=1 Tax=Corynespora cassiicola Philippines TaxID=1448308 RepID=A0A2T2P0M9_CORCC|nr:hypothetical protein BS50DRAFT_570584 [Corynespora cassiicola Philippines]
MTTEDDASQPPSAPPPTTSSEKPTAAPKAPATFSSFINKNASGKKFAPKAVRRRPAAATTAPSATTAAAATPTATPAAPAEQATDNASAEKETPAAQLESATTGPQLPTPAATQDPVPIDTSLPIPTPSIETIDSSAVVAPSPVPVELPALTPVPVELPALTPVPNVVDPVSAAARASPQIDGDNTTTQEPVHSSVSPRSVEGELDSGRSPKRRRLNVPAHEHSNTVSDIARTESAPISQEVTASSSIHVEPEIASDTAPTPTPPTEGIEQQTVEASSGHAASEQPDPRDISKNSDAINLGTPAGEPATTTTKRAAPKPRPGRRKQPWTSVNQSESNEGEATNSQFQPSSKALGKRRAAELTESEVGENQDQQGNGGDAPQTTTHRPARKPRGKKKAADATETTDDATENVEPDGTEPPAKKARKPRSDKGKRKKKTTTEDGEAGENEENADNAGEGDAAEEAPRRKRRKKSTTQGTINENGEGAAEGSAEPRRRGRAPREPTPPDAENEVIETSTTFMDDLASRDVRRGKLSEREKKMRLINWAEVKERRRQEERDAAMRSQKARDAVNARLDEAGAAREDATQQSSGPRFEMIDGNIVLIQDSGTIDREGDADRAIEMMEEVDEQDLTNHITTRSFMRNRKRNPAEFMIPGQQKRWTVDMTEKFYDGLRMFGTDFEMIATWFPHHTRRSIKLKFVREERAHPEYIKQILLGQRNSNWDDYLKETSIPAAAFDEADAIKASLEAERLEMERELAEARAEAEEERRQRRLAGIESDNEKGDNDQENGKGKKKKRGKEKVTFADDAVEVLDDDPNWGVE